MAKKIIVEDLYSLTRSIKKCVQHFARQAEHPSGAIIFLPFMVFLFSINKRTIILNIQIF